MYSSIKCTLDAYVRELCLYRFFRFFFIFIFSLLVACYRVRLRCFVRPLFAFSKHKQNYAHDELCICAPKY